MPASVGLDSIVKRRKKGNGEEVRRSLQFYFLKECGVSYEEFYELPIPYIFEIVEEQEKVNKELENGS